jgi:hypothetical protein
MRLRDVALEPFTECGGGRMNRETSSVERWAISDAASCRWHPRSVHVASLKVGSRFRQSSETSAVATPAVARDSRRFGSG